MQVGQHVASLGNMSDPRVLVVGNTVVTVWGRDQIRCLSEQARRRGITLIGADTPGNLSNASPEELARVDEVVALDVHDAQACRKWAAGRRDIDAVLTIRELSVYATAMMAEELGVPGNDPEAVSRIRNKDLCRDRLRKAGFAQPVTALCETAADAEQFMACTQPGPWVVKPRDGLASIGVSRVESARDLPEALQRFGTPPPALGSLPSSPEFLIETFVEGEEYSAEGVMVGGVPHVLALTRKTLTEDFVEIRHVVPSGLDEASAACAQGAVAGALIAAGITRGIFHVEFWVTADGIVLGELHDRPGGDFIHTLVENHRPGVEFYGTLIDDLLGRPPEPVPAASRAAGAAFVLSPPGRLGAVRGWQELTQHPAVIAADLQLKAGDEVRPVTDSFGRHGVFVVAGDTIDEVDRLLTYLSASVVFEMA